MTAVIRNHKAITAAILAAIAVLVLAALFGHLDWFPALHTYGVTIGTSSHYCSADLVHGHLMATCETAH
jgi:hypothetical protein